jgi:hypothetical protein
MRTEKKNNPREIFAECDKTQLKRLLIALVARSSLTKDPNEEEGEIRMMMDEQQCGGSDGRAGSPGKASSSIPTRTETRESIPLIDDDY